MLLRRYLNILPDHGGCGAWPAREVSIGRGWLQHIGALLSIDAKRQGFTREVFNVGNVED